MARRRVDHADRTRGLVAEGKGRGRVGAAGASQGARRCILPGHALALAARDAQQVRLEVDDAAANVGHLGTAHQPQGVPARLRVRELDGHLRVGKHARGLLFFRQGHIGRPNAVPRAVPRCGGAADFHSLRGLRKNRGEIVRNVMSTPKRPTKKRPSSRTPTTPVASRRRFGSFASAAEGLGGSGGLFGAAAEEENDIVADLPHVLPNYHVPPMLFNEYRIKKTNVLDPAGKSVRVVFPNAENRPMTNAEVAALNALTPLQTADSFVGAPDGIYIYGFFDTGFGALKVRSAVEFLTGHKILARRMAAKKVYAAGELKKTGPTTVNFNLTTGMYKDIEHKRSPEELNAFVIGAFGKIDILATVSTDKPTPNSYIDALTTMGINEQTMLTSRGFTIAIPKKAARKTRKRRSTRRA